MDRLGRQPASRAIGKDLAAEETYALHRSVRYRFPRWQTIVSGPGEQLQCDLVDCSEYPEANNGTWYLFCCIDMFSKYAWARPLTSKRYETAGTMQTFLDDMQDGPPLAVQSDKGTEMHAAPFQWLLKSRDIHFFTSKNDDIKCVMVERFQRMLQGMIHRHMMANRTRRFVDVLPALLHTSQCHWHGDAHHELGRCGASMGTPVLAAMSTTRGRPGLSATHTRWPRQEEQDPSPVRQGYKGHWSKENFHMEAVRDTSPETFYGPELKKVTPPDYFDVESILDTTRQGNVTETEYLVKWAGYLTSLTSWESDVVRISGCAFTH